jgi:hypothetical protein
VRRQRCKGSFPVFALPWKLRSHLPGTVSVYGAREADRVMRGSGAMIRRFARWLLCSYANPHHPHPHPHHIHTLILITSSSSSSSHPHPHHILILIHSPHSLPPATEVNSHKVSSSVINGSCTPNAPLLYFNHLQLPVRHNQKHGVVWTWSSSMSPLLRFDGSIFRSSRPSQLASAYSHPHSRRESNRILITTKAVIIAPT